MGIQDEIVSLKARLFELFELDKEKEVVRSRLIFLLGKSEGIAETEKLIEDKINEGLQKVLEAQKPEAQA